MLPRPDTLRRYGWLAALLFGFALGVAWSGTACAGTITVTLDGTPVAITTTGDHDYAVADSVSKVNQQIVEQNVRNQADNDAALATWSATNAARAAKVCPTGNLLPTNPPTVETAPCPEPPLTAPALKTISPTLTREQWVAEQITGVLNAVPADKKAAVCAALGLAGKLPECP